MALNEKEVPSGQELNAHVRTAVDGAVRWLDRALVQPHPGPEAWDQAGFYSRMLLLRGLERGELLGWVLQRDRLAAAPADGAQELRQAQAYWQEARPDMHRALEGLRGAADLPPIWATSREALREARTQLTQAATWLEHLAVGLDRQPERVLDRSDEHEALVTPEQSLDFDPL